MRADPREARQLSALVKIIWPEHSLEELTKIIISYMSSENSAVFAEILNGEYAGWRCVPYVMIMWKDAKPVPSDTWKASVSRRNTVNRESPENWYPNVSNGHEKKDASNLPVTVS